MAGLLTAMATPQAQPALDAISPAEARVLAELLRGLSNKAIAAALVLSPRTIESHVSSLLGKTGCRSRTELLLWALESDRSTGDTMPEEGRRINF
jgi:DNA-binding NarL/FixJ family response regulator